MAIWLRDCVLLLADERPMAWTDDDKHDLLNNELQIVRNAHSTDIICLTLFCLFLSYIWYLC